MIDEAFILAGGLGTRLRQIVNDVPKPMADINGKPFLEYILNYLIKYKIKKCILAVGYKKEIIKNYFGNKYKNLDIIYSDESEPLDTGGALLNGISLINNNYFIFLNGDTFFPINLNILTEFVKNKDTDIVIALKYIDNPDRYGLIEINNNNEIINFIEKGTHKSGYINGGIYIINKNIFNNLNLQNKFSFEKDLLEKYYSKLKIYGLPFDNYFIDIGIPDDYRRAIKELRKL